MASKDLEPWKAGDPFSASHLNQGLDAVRKLSNITGGNGVAVSQVGNGYTVSLVPPGPHGLILFGRLTAQYAAKKWLYDWVEWELSPTGWAASGDSGTAPGYPAVWPDSDDTTSHTGKTYAFARGLYRDDTYGEVPCVYCLGPVGVSGYTGSQTVVTDVKYVAGTGLVQTKVTNTYDNGDLIGVTSPTDTTIIVENACP